MITIKGYIDGQKLTLERKVLATGMSVGNIQFSFSDEWDGYTKTAIFFKDMSKVYQQLIADDNSVSIPREAILDNGIIYIGVFGVLGDAVITSEVVGYNFRLGAITNDLITPAPTPNIYEQLLDEYNKLKARVSQLEAEVSALKSK